MIATIEIMGAATFHDVQKLEGLRKFNYFFGANGSGKTTISKIINAPDNYPACSVIWENQFPLEKRVYNRYFVEKNFNQDKLRGVFTLGETAPETLKRIDEIKVSNKKLQNDIESLVNTLQGPNGNGGKKTELSNLTLTYETKFYTMKQKHSDKMSGARSGEGMKGSIASKKDFMKKVLLESLSNKALLLTQVELEEKAKIMFSNTLIPANLLPEINTADVLLHEKNSILQKRIIGKDDVDIAAMIDKLGNSDWVHQGVSFYEANDGVCPFCQQSTSDIFRKSLTEYFDESFIQDISAINALADNYIAETFRLQSHVQQLIDTQSPFLDAEKLETEKQLLDSLITINVQRLTEKQKESSNAATLESLENVLVKIAELIASANVKIVENNRIVSNLRSEKANLTAQIWKFVISELALDISEYDRQKNAIESAINKINQQIAAKRTEKINNENELRDLEKQITSIVPTRDAINHLLDMFGFKSFKLDLGDETNTYKLVREDGSDAKSTLSEGEKNFLTFLYFYHLLKGSQTETDIANDKIVVIDDPVSSLDNDVLFIVSTLTREIIQDIRENSGSVKQIFILTHNIYFHKEVVFDRSRKDTARSDETFWLVKKNGKYSFVEKRTNNPIKTSYELLWDEVRNNSRNNATIQNVLRRILENYFKIIGGMRLDNLYKEFEGEDKLKCKALCSWINDGSHSAFGEDFYTPLDSAMIQKFLSIFRQIFEKTNHISHYNMMMGIDGEGEAPAYSS